MPEQRSDVSRRWCPAVVTRTSSEQAGFAVIRLIAVLLVVLDHCAPLTWSRPSVLPRSWGLDLGYLALVALIAMSGYQVAGSWRRDPRATPFLLKRLLRIWPPLMVALLVCTFALGPLMSSLPVVDYLGDHRTWRYLVHNATLYLTEYRLPGVFEGNPYPGAPVNGSLWTLPVEFSGYLLLIMVGLVGRRHLTAATVLGAVVLALWFLSTPWGTADWHVGTLPATSLAEFLSAFAIGTVIRSIGASRRKLLLGAWIGVGIYATVGGTTPGTASLILTTSCITVVAARTWPEILIPPRRLRNGSYGIYLYGFPLQQTTIALGVTELWAVASITLPAAYLAGVLSWSLVEEPTQSLKSLIPRVHRISSPVSPGTGTRIEAEPTSHASGRSH